MQIGARPRLRDRLRLPTELSHELPIEVVSLVVQLHCGVKGMAGNHDVGDARVEG